MNSASALKPIRHRAHWASVVLFGGLSLFMLWFGFTYATVKEMLWFHAAAVPVEAREEVKALYFALMSLVGGASMGLGGLGLCVVYGPVRSGAPWATRAVAASYCVALIMAAVTAERLADATGAPTSWHIMGVLMGLVVLADRMHAWANSNTKRDALGSMGL
jgi:hypothetical protein